MNSSEISRKTLRSLKVRNLEKYVVLDVGANVGDFSALCKKIFSNLKLYVIEPQPEVQSILQNRLGGSHIYIQTAISNEIGSQYLRRSGIGDRKATLSHIPDQNSIPIEVTTIDKLVNESKIDFINLLKIDAEGADFLVLKGAKKTLESARIGAILFEINYKVFEKGGSPQEIENYLRIFGYNFFYRATKWLGFIELTTLPNFRVETQNILATKNSLTN